MSQQGGGLEGEISRDRSGHGSARQVSRKGSRHCRPAAPRSADEARSPGPRLPALRPPRPGGPPDRRSRRFATGARSRFALRRHGRPPPVARSRRYTPPRRPPRRQWRGWETPWAPRCPPRCERLAHGRTGRCAARTPRSGVRQPATGSDGHSAATIADKCDKTSRCSRSSGSCTAPASRSWSGTSLPSPVMSGGPSSFCLIP